MELIDINKQLFESAGELRNGARLIFRYARAYAEAEREYRVQMAKKIMELRDRKIPATLIENIARGEIADLRYKRDLAELTYQACRESLRAQQSQISALQTILNYQTEVEGKGA